MPYEPVLEKALTLVDSPISRALCLGEAEFKYFHILAPRIPYLAKDELLKLLKLSSFQDTILLFASTGWIDLSFKEAWKVARPRFKKVPFEKLLTPFLAAPFLTAEMLKNLASAVDLSDVIAFLSKYSAPSLPTTPLYSAADLGMDFDWKYASYANAHSKCIAAAGDTSGKHELFNFSYGFVSVSKYKVSPIPKELMTLDEFMSRLDYSRIRRGIYNFDNELLGLVAAVDKNSLASVFGFTSRHTKALSFYAYSGPFADQVSRLVSKAHAAFKEDLADCYSNRWIHDSPLLHPLLEQTSLKLNSTTMPKGSYLILSALFAKASLEQLKAFAANHDAFAGTFEDFLVSFNQA